MYNSRKLSLACISSLMVFKVLDQLVTSFPRAITDYRSLCIISEKDSVTGLEVTLQSSSRIFQVTGLTFSPHKCKFIVCIHALTRDESLNRALLIPWKHSCKTNSRKPRSSERVPRTLTDGTLTERERNRTEQNG